MQKFKRGDLCKTILKVHDTLRDNNGYGQGHYQGFSPETIVEVQGQWKDFPAFSLCWLPVEKVYIAIHNTLLEKM